VEREREWLSLALFPDRPPLLSETEGVGTSAQRHPLASSAFFVWLPVRPTHYSILLQRRDATTEALVVAGGALRSQLEVATLGAASEATH